MSKLASRLASLITSENKVLRRTKIGLVVVNDTARLAREGEEPTEYVEVRQPTVAERTAIFKAGGGKGTSQVEGADFGALKVEAAILCAVEPGSTGIGTRVFADATFRDVLKAQPSGGIVDALGDAVFALMKGEDAGKGSTASPNSTSGSDSPGASAAPSQS